MNTFTSKATIIFCVLFISMAYALPNSHTIILKDTRANLKDIHPQVACYEPTPQGPLKIEIYKANNYTWRVFYDTPERLVSCTIVFTYKFGYDNPCVYDAHVGFMIGNGMEPSAEWYMHGIFEASLNPISVSLPYCPSKASLSGYEDYNIKHTSNLYL